MSDSATSIWDQLVLAATPGLEAGHDGITSDEFIQLIDNVVVVSRDEWAEATANLASEQATAPTASDWVDAGNNRSAAILDADDGTTAVWIRWTPTGESQLEFYGQHDTFTGFVAIPDGDTKTVGTPDTVLRATPVSSHTVSRNPGGHDSSFESQPSRVAGTSRATPTETPVTLRNQTSRSHPYSPIRHIGVRGGGHSVWF